MNKKLIQAERDQLRGQISRLQKEAKRIESEAEAASAALRTAALPEPLTTYADLDSEAILNHAKKLAACIQSSQDISNAIDELKIKLGDED